MIYLDNAATSFPKPEPAFKAGLAEYLALSASPGRGGYDAAVEAEARVDSVRHRLAELFGAPGWQTAFSHNATEALNTLIQGLVPAGGHVVSTRLEHNSVLRPLHHLAQSGRGTFDLAPFNARGVVEPEAVARAIRPETGLVILNHASNVLGTVQPAAEIGRLCSEKGIPLILDASQSAGQTAIQLQAWQASGLAFTGHKSLLGPTGLGGLVFDPALDIRPSRFGGTGVDSAGLFHSPDYPERLEAGTINLLGILILDHCLDFLTSPQGRAAAEGEAELLRRLVEGLTALEGISLDCPGWGPDRIPVVSANLTGWSPADAGMVLDGDHGLAVRTGLHCAPLVHQDLGHGRAGSIRFSLGPFNTADDIEALLTALAEMLDRS